MDERIRRPFMYMDPKDIWDAVREAYSNRGDSSQIFELKKKLWLSKQGDRDITTYFNEMLSLWQELDLCYNDDVWENPKDLVRAKRREEDDRVFMFLAGANHSFDETKGRVLGRKPLPTVRTVFSELRQEEARKRVMYDHAPSILENDNMALVSKRFNGAGDKKTPFSCDFCGKLWHTKDKCYKLHGKPSSTKKKGDGRAIAAMAETSEEKTASPEPLPFTQEQLQHLYKLFNSPQFTLNSSSSPAPAQKGPELGEDDWQC
ncbi:unnamed protein product [Cuscuta epithymum]|uniref:Retrotransposon gag domain-containing protein n=1 Tax=Cuscuta epithymum TaxID=186058 RepID=A0AAV0DNK1_9ASTE|nr:unnamed protein product [Cuscuta epithymum]